MEPQQSQVGKLGVQLPQYNLMLRPPKQHRGYQAFILYSDAIKNVALHMSLRMPCCALQSESAGVEVEYVSAPREYEELLQAKDEPESSNTLVPGGGLGFVSAGTSTAGLGSGGDLSFQ